MAGRRLTATLLALVLVASACGRPDSGFDMASLSAAIPAALVPDDPGAVSNVACPDLATSEATTITCTAAIGGNPVDILVAISSDGTADVSTDSTLIDLAGVALAASLRLGNDLGVESSVECPGSVVVSVVDSVIRCTATDGNGIVRDLVVTILDDSGSWSMDLAS